MIDGEEDQEKFEQLYWHYKNLLAYRAKELLSARELVDDALNITFARIAANMHMVEEAISPRTKRLLVVTLEHVAFNLQKEEKRQQARTVTLEEAAFMETEINSPTDNLVAEAILQLSSPYQQVLLLKYAEGYTNKEIAQLLDLTVANVEKRLSRGKKQLKELLEELYQL